MEAIVADKAVVFVAFAIEDECQRDFLRGNRFRRVRRSNSLICP